MQHSANESRETFNADIREYMLGKERLNNRARLPELITDVPTLQTQVALLLRLDRQKEEDLLKLSKEYDTCKDKEKTLECTLWLDWLLVQMDGLNAERTKISLAINRLHEAQKMVSILQDGHQAQYGCHVTSEHDRAGSVISTSEKDVRILQDIGEDDVFKLDEIDSSTDETARSSTSQDRLAPLRQEFSSFLSEGSKKMPSSSSSSISSSISSSAMDQLGQLSSLLSNLQFTPRSKSSSHKSLMYFEGDQSTDLRLESGRRRYVF
ncbi:hypothetical protein GUITHDRAFT_101932 [Guillardia theta CCMP2712]|uniref:Uncharacterized protein n=1 Tax=Guillardia theta (strain CCMP2712) TaxID=905079 RepID=L1JUY5_GUITC|nr:hypothetical protein GUITHDRAFT_101932 [Guillardia theta CCMP2712]EKX52020.1 hypothetical protein GUITHDRAFT_101932 [Guillardia theta CCMP2712]|eukprot:XP_005839000.1 hypothetical protein GUITHDRAFT_101932 [Guillardia theta CCMP2712]